MPGEKSFWETFPGVLTALGGLIAAGAALLTALYSIGIIGQHPGNNTNPVVVSPGPSPGSGAQGGTAPPAAKGDGTNPSVFVLGKRSFEFPGDGQRNNNLSIGPFCCTGETATVTKTDGTAVGYIYYYGFEDAVNLPGGGSAARIIRVLVSGEANDQPDAQQVQNSVAFAAGDAVAGATRSVTVGLLTYTATLTRAPLNGGRFDMGAFAVTVKVDPAGP